MEIGIDINDFVKQLYIYYLLICYLLIIINYL